MFLGIRQSSLLLPQPWTTYVLISYVLWLATLRGGLLIHNHVYLKRSMYEKLTSVLMKYWEHSHIFWSSYNSIIPPVSVWQSCDMWSEVLFVWPTAMGSSDTQCILSNQLSLDCWVGNSYKMILKCRDTFFVVVNVNSINPDWAVAVAEPRGSKAWALLLHAQMSPFCLSCSSTK